MSAPLAQVTQVEDAMSTDGGSASTPASSVCSDSGPDPEEAANSNTFLKDAPLYSGRSRAELVTDVGRLWSDIHHTAQWGALPNSPGMARLALSDEDKLVRDYFVQEATNIGCQVSIDEMGNIFAVLPGENNSIPPIGMGSHLDTQPAGKPPLI